MMRDVDCASRAAIFGERDVARGRGGANRLAATRTEDRTASNRGSGRVASSQVHAARFRSCMPDHCQSGQPSGMHQNFMLRLPLMTRPSP